MYKALRNAIEKAEKKTNEANIALQAVNKYITFRGFKEDDEPELSMCSGDEPLFLSQLLSNDEIEQILTSGNLKLLLNKEE